jgi:transcription elongation factor Elf1
MVSGFSGDEQRKHHGRCIDCGEVLELYMLDLKKNKRILQCRNCGLFHTYSKDLLGKWKLLKVTKVSDL